MRLVDLTVWQVVLLILAAPLIFAMGELLLFVLTVLVCAFSSRKKGGA